MAAIYGFVQGNVVVLPQDADLPDGTMVEVRVAPSNDEVSDDAAGEEQFKRTLVEMGVLAKVRTPAPIPPDQDRTPVKVSGKPLSEMIIEERR